MCRCQAAYACAYTPQRVTVWLQVEEDELALLSKLAKAAKVNEAAVALRWLQPV